VSKIYRRNYFGWLVEGVILSRELVVTVAMGFTQEGEMWMLDFSERSIESYEGTRELIGRLKKSGFHVEGRLLAIS
jgi:hypothetical protein